MGVGPPVSGKGSRTPWDKQGPRDDKSKRNSQRPACPEHMPHGGGVEAAVLLRDLDGAGTDGAGTDADEVGPKRPHHPLHVN